MLIDKLMSLQDVIKANLNDKDITNTGKEWKIISNVLTNAARFTLGDKAKWLNTLKSIGWAFFFTI